MKWIGQHIYDLVSRFRDDVYLEDLTTTTETNVLVVDSNGLISKSTTLADDIIESEIDTLAGLTSFGAAGATTNIVAGDLTMYNAVNDGNPTISLGSSANDRFEIKALYNSGAQTIDSVNFTTYTTSITTNDGRYRWFVDEVELAAMLDTAFVVYANITANDADATLGALDTTTSSATQGGRIRLTSNDGAAMADDHRLGVIEFRGAEDSSSTFSTGARIQAICRDAWDGSNNDADLEFYTTDGTTESKVLTLDADKLATFAGAVTVTGAITGNLTGNASGSSGSCTGEAATVATIAGLAPNTATTQATQPNIESIGTDGDTLSILGDTLSMTNTTTNKPEIKLINQTDDSTGPKFTFLNNRYDSGNQDGEDYDKLGTIRFQGYDDGTPSIQNYAQIYTQIDDATASQESGKLIFQVANHDGGLGSGLILTGGSQNDEIDVTLGLGAASVVTIPGDIDLAGDIDVDGTLETDALTIAGVTLPGTSGRRYGSTIKILPSDFMINEDAAAPLSFKDGGNSGVHINDTANEALAFVTIPEGMKATHVDVYATHNRTLKVWEVDLNASFDFTSTTKGTGACNTQLDITDVNATATNYLAIQIALSATTQRIWGGIVTIAPQ